MASFFLPFTFAKYLKGRLLQAKKPFRYVIIAAGASPRLKMGIMNREILPRLLIGRAGMNGASARVAGAEVTCRSLLCDTKDKRPKSLQAI